MVVLLTSWYGYSDLLQLISAWQKTFTGQLGQLLKIKKFQKHS